MANSTIEPKLCGLDPTRMIGSTHRSNRVAVAEILAQVEQPTVIANQRGRGLNNQ